MKRPNASSRNLATKYVTPCRIYIYIYAATHCLPTAVLIVASIAVATAGYFPCGRAALNTLPVFPSMLGGDFGSRREAEKKSPE